MHPREASGAVDYLYGHSEDAATAHRLLRKAVITSGPLDSVTCELIVLGSFVTSRIESGFKAHARRLLNEGVPTAAIRQAVLVTLGATATFPLVVEALHWFDEIIEPREEI